MQIIEPSFISLLSAYLFFIGCFLIFIWIAGLYYLKVKWLPFLEETLDDGVRFYTLNLFFSCIGVLQYATVFLCSFHAKRYGMFEKRENVPKHIQKLFIFSFYWLMFCVALIILSAFIHD
jgi:amino acid transporter